VRDRVGRIVDNPNNGNVKKTSAGRRAVKDKCDMNESVIEESVNGPVDTRTRSTSMRVDVRTGERPGTRSASMGADVRTGEEPGRHKDK